MAYQADPVADIRRIAVLFNPLKKRKWLDAYMQGLRHKAPALMVDVRVPTSAADVRVQAEKARDEGFDLLVVAGGDGTLWQALNGLVHGQTALTALPLGTGNDFARALGIETVEDGVRAVFEGAVRRVDVGRCAYCGEDGQAKTSYFCSTAGAGVMANVFKLERRPAGQALKKLLGNGVWPLLTFYSFLMYRPVDAQVALNDRVLRESLLAFEISKVVEAGGVAFTPYAHLDNGIFDAWMVAQASFWKMCLVFYHVLRGGERHLSLPAFEYFSDRDAWNSRGLKDIHRIAIAAETPMPVHLHGDYTGQTPAEFHIEAGALKVLGLR